MRTRKLLITAFAAIAILFAAVEIVTLFGVSQVRQEAHALVADMLQGVELVSRIGRDVGRERRLVNVHIFENRPLELRRVEREIDQARADYADAAARYAALPQPATEAGLWRQLSGDVQALRAPLDHALQLSRSDRDDEARAEVMALDRRFVAIDGAVTALINVNRADADATLVKVDALQRTSLFLFGALALVGIILSITLGAAVTHLVQRGETQLTRQAELLEQQNRELDAFAGRVAHDLRGPLTTITLAVDNLSRGVNSARPDMMLRRGVDRMQAMIEDLLAFSRVDEKLAAAVCDPSVAAAQVCQDVTAQVEHHGGRLVVAVEPGQVRCAEGLLRQVLWNLIDNAVKYHREGVGPEVEIFGHAHEPGYDLMVRDNGMGMSADEVQHAFEPLYRSGRVRMIQGTGLGLSLVKRVLEAAGGEVDVESEVGQGTTFVLHLPCA